MVCVHNAALTKVHATRISLLPLTTTSSSSNLSVFIIVIVGEVAALNSILVLRVPLHS